MRPATLALRLVDACGGWLKTTAARENGYFGHGSRMTRHGQVDNILGDRDAVRVGENSVLSGHFQIFGHGGAIRVGDWCFVGQHSYIWSAASIDIGNRVLISHHVNIIDTSSHPLNAERRFTQTKSILLDGHPRQDPGLKSAPIVIVDDAWISFGATVMPGVTIGEGAIVGARAVVTKDVTPYTVVAGNPARVIKTLDRENPMLSPKTNDTAAYAQAENPGGTE